MIQRRWVDKLGVQYLETITIGPRHHYDRSYKPLRLALEKLILGENFPEIYNFPCEKPTILIKPGGFNYRLDG
jgi:hypothetical protein